MRTVLNANVLEQVDVAMLQDKNMVIQRLPHHAQNVVLHVTTPALSMILTMNVHSRENIFRMELDPHSSRQKILVGINDLELTCGSEPVMDKVCTAMVGSARTGRVCDAGSDREGRCSEVCHFGDTC